MTQQQTAARQQTAMVLEIQRGDIQNWQGLEELNAALHQGWRVQSMTPLGEHKGLYLALAVLEHQGAN